MDRKGCRKRPDTRVLMMVLLLFMGPLYQTADGAELIENRIDSDKLSPGNRSGPEPKRDADEIEVNTEGSSVRRPGPTKLQEKASCPVSDHDEKSDTFPNKPQEMRNGSVSDDRVSRANDDWTLMIYLDANHNLAPHAAGDMAEINASSASNVDVLVLKDDNSTPVGNDTRLYHINEGDTQQMSPAWLDDEENMGDEDTLFDFVNWSLSNYPSDRTFLVLWDHGSAYWGCCRDRDPGDHSDTDNLRIFEVCNALDRSLPQGEKLDIIGFCACNMANTEVCHSLSQHADHLIASEQSGWLTRNNGYCWDFSTIIDEMNSNFDPLNLGEFIINTTMVNSVNDLPHRSHTWELIDLGEMDSVADRLDLFSDELIDAFEDHYIEISQARLRTEEYKSGKRPDLYHFAENIQGQASLPWDLKNAAASLMTGIESAVLYEEHRTGDEIVTSGLYDPVEVMSRSDEKDKTHGPVENAHGMTIYFPVNRSAESLSNYRSSSYMEDFTCNSRWDEFLELYTRVIYVDDDSTVFQGGSLKYPYRTIGQALNIDYVGCTLRVFAGSYPENCSIMGSVSIIGNGTKTNPETHICPTEGTALEILGASDIELSLLDIYSSASNSEKNTYIDTCQLNINNCTFGECGSDTLYIKDASMGVIENCTVRNAGLSGISLNNAESVIIRRCDIYQNRLGITMDGCKDCTVSHSKVHDVSAYCFHMEHSEGARVVDCDIYNSQDDAFYMGILDDEVDARFNYWGDPSGPGGEGPGTGSDIPEDVHYSPWLGNWAGTEPVQEFHVDATGLIQDAVDHATPLDEVNVYQGIYDESVWINKTLVLSGMVDVPPYPEIFTDIGEDVVCITAENVIMRRFNITTGGSPGNGISVGGREGPADHALLEEINILSVGEDGIHVDHRTQDISITNFHVESANGNGIRLSDSLDLAASDVQMGPGSVMRCNLSGIKIEDDCTDNSMIDCELIENEQNGLHVMGEDTLVLECVIENNGENGVLAEDSSGTTVIWGVIDKNKGYGVVEKGTSSNTDARFNHWGDPLGPFVTNGVGPNILYSPWLGLVPGSSPMTFYNDPTGSVQTAIDNSSGGDTIRLFAGEYEGPLLINKTVSLTGNGSSGDVSLINSSGDGMIITAQRVSISSLSVTTGVGGGNGIVMTGPNVTLEDVRVYDTGGDGIHMIRSSGSIFRNSSVSGCGGSGIVLRGMFMYLFHGSSDNSLINITIEGCDQNGILVGQGCTGNEIRSSFINDNGLAGIFFNGTDNCTVMDCSVSGNDPGVRGKGSDDILINGCEIYGNDHGLYLEASGNWIIGRCNIRKNTGYGVFAFLNNPFVDARYNHWGHSSGPGGMGPGSGDAVSDRVFYSPWLGYKVGSVPQTFHVDNTGTIGDALGMARENDTIMVMNGTYMEHLMISKKVHIIGQGPQGCIIKGKGKGNVVTIEAPQITFSGFHLTDGGKSGISASLRIAADGVEISDILCTNSSNGLVLFGCLETRVTDTFCRDNTIGILLFGSHRNEIVNASSMRNEFAGIELRKARNNSIIESDISWNRVGILCGNSSTGNTVHYNHILKNKVFGIKVDGKKGEMSLNATRNWWGHNRGPFHSRHNPRARGENITDDVPFSPWLDENGDLVYSEKGSEQEEEGSDRESQIPTAVVLAVAVIMVLALLATSLLYRRRLASGTEE